ncbi:hypothetical protein JOC24_003453 [Streptomyces sp. HB132]|nr:hypothetical protein [Streptomyces sp. HB132]
MPEHQAVSGTIMPGVLAAVAVVEHVQYVQRVARAAPFG